MICDSAIWDEFIYKEQLATVARSAAIKCDKIRVTQAGKDLYFIPELFDTPEVVLVQTLDCN